MKNNRRYWVLPGGGVEYREPVPCALQRELKEELNIRVSVEEFLFMNESIYPDGSRHILNLYFSVKYESGDLRLAREERLDGYDFFSADKIPDLLIYPSLNKILVEYLARDKVSRHYYDIGWIS